MKKCFIALCVVLLVSSLTITQARAELLISNSSTFYVPLNNEAYITQSTAAPSLFNQTLFTSGNETKSGTVAFSAIPYFNIESTKYFQFIYDMKETGGQGVGGRSLKIDSINISAGNVNNVWTLNDSILLNSIAPNFTATPLGAGGDMALFVPVKLFNGMGLTGSSQLTFTVKQSLSNNGPDEWVVLGSAGGGSFFGTNDRIESNPAPIPAAVWLFGSGLIGIVGVRRRFKK